MKHRGMVWAVAAVAAAGLFLGGCGGGTASQCAPGSGKCTAGETCAANADCVAGLSCNQTTKKCERVFVCTADSQCTAASGVAACAEAGRCICLGGTCQERGCSSDAFCSGGKICTNGRCADRPAAAGLTCSILTPPSVLRQGQTLQLVAVAKNANQAIIAGQSFQWQSSNPGAVSVGTTTGLATGGSTTGAADITCTVVGGSATPSPAVRIQNYADATGIRAVVVSERTGQPLAGAIVVFERGGQNLPQSPVTTGTDGIAQVPLAGADPVNVHVFKGGHTYVSIFGTTSTDLLVPLIETPDNTKAGGFKGTFQFCGRFSGTQCVEPLLPNFSDTVEFGLAGASLGGQFIDLDFEKLIGESLRRRVKIGNLFDDYLGLPSGLVLKLGEQNIKEDYAALAQAGLRHAWGIGGKVPFDKLIQVLTPVLGGGASVDNLPFGQIIAQILPFFEKFKHFVKTDVNVTEVPRVPDTADINGNGRTDDLVPDFANPTAFPTVEAKVQQALTLSTQVTIPALPRYGGAFLEGVLVLSGANVTGRGLVPLGLSAAVDAPKQGETPDGMVDTVPDDSRNPASIGNQNTLSFKMAPLHDGLEGSRFFVVALAISLRLSSGTPGSVSGIIVQPDSIGPTTDLQGGTFLGFPEAASFNLNTRVFSLGTPVTGAAFYRADFKGPDGDWVVYFKSPATAGAPAFSLPAVPSGLIERAVGNCSGSPCTRLRVFSLATRAAAGSSTAPSLDQLVGFGTVNLGRLNDFVSAFSNAECQQNGSCAPPPRQ